MDPRQRLSRAHWKPFALLVGGVGLVATLLVIPFGPEGESTHQGDLAPRSLVAGHSAQYESAPLTEAVRAEAARKVEDVYVPPDPLVSQQQGDKLRQLFDGFRLLSQRTSLTLAQRVNEAQSIPGASELSPSAQFNILNLDRAAFEDFRERSLKAVADVLIRQVLPQKAPDRIAEYLDSTANRPPDPAQLAALREVLRAYVVQNVKVDQAATQQARDAARARVSSVISTYTAGQLIAPEGKRLDAADIEALRKTGILTGGFDYWRLLGGAGAGFGFAVVLAFYLMVGARSSRDLGVAGSIAVLAIVLLGATRLTLPQVLPDRDHTLYAFFLPVGAAAFAASGLRGRAAGTGVAVACGLFATFIGAVYSDLSGSGFTGSLAGLELAAGFIATGLAACAVAALPQRPWRTAAASCGVALALGLVLIIFWLMDEPRDNERLRWIGLAAVLAGLGSVAVGWFATEAIRRNFGLTSPGSLARLGQTSQPLLRRLQSEAPGTYQHSLAVATLAEGAAGRIGADGTLARTGALYHDVGKLGQPALFIENSFDAGESPHAALSPQESAAAIRAHVARGLAIAHEHGVPAQVSEFIPQHHGTRLVTFFYRQAVTSGAPFDVADFRYAGPKPQSREAAIVMLADSSEAVVRANADHSTAQIARLVDEVIAERIGEGEFDECDISLRELRLVAASFKETLRAIYHPRLPYPVLGPEDLARLAAAD